MKTTIEFNCNGAAFDHDAPKQTIAQILREIADEVEQDKVSAKTINCPNGNVIGNWAVTGY